MFYFVVVFKGEMNMGYQGSCDALDQLVKGFTTIILLTVSQDFISFFKMYVSDFNTDFFIRSERVTGTIPLIIDSTVS